MNSIFGQIDSPKRQSLATILHHLQQRYECNFTYADENISQIFLVPPSRTMTLEESISYLEQRTELAYVQIDVKNIAIRSPESIDSTSFCGTLIDAITLRAIPRATLTYGSEITYSNAQGKFEISATSFSNKINIKATGYASQSLSLKLKKQGECPKIQLYPKVVQLNTTIIDNYLTKGIIQQANGSLEIDFKDFGQLPGLIEPDVLQTLQALPGIQSVNESVTDLNIRGGTNDQNLILWNGIKMYQSGHFFGLISAFNPYLTDKATVIKNGTSARYGDGASGTISITTSDSIPDKLKAGIGLNMINADIFIDTPLSSKLGLQLAVRKSFSELVPTPTYTNYFNKAFQNTEVFENNNVNLNSDNQFSFYDMSSQLFYKIDPDAYLKANFLWIENDLIFKENGIIDGNALSRQSGAAQRSLSGSLLYHKTWNKHFNTQMQFYGTFYKLQAENADIQNQQRLLQRNEVLETSFKLTNTHALTKNITLSNGYQFTETGITDLQDVTNPVVRSEIKSVLRSHSLFAEGSYANKQQLHPTTFNIGVRATYFQKFDRVLLEPRMSLNQQFWNHFSVFLAGELKSQATSQIITIQNDFLGIENRRWQLSNNSTIPLIKSYQTSLGLHYKYKGWLCSVEGYVKKVKGITSQSQGFQNQFQTERAAGSYNIIGGDFLLYKKFHSLTAWGSYTLAKNTYLFETFSPATFPNNFDVRHTLSIGASYALNNFKISTGLSWHSGKPITRITEDLEILNNELNFEDPNSSNLSDFLRVDASMTYDFKLTDTINVHSGISLWNVFDHRNVFNSYYRIIDQNAININQNGLRFTPNATIRVYLN